MVPTYLTVESDIRHAPRAPLFPYTTLFRSLEPRQPDRRLGWRLRLLLLLRAQTLSAIALRQDAQSAAFTVSWSRSEEQTSELQSRRVLVCRLLLEKKIVRMSMQPVPY